MLPHLLRLDTRLYVYLYMRMGNVRNRPLTTRHMYQGTSYCYIISYAVHLAHWALHKKSILVRRMANVWFNATHCCIAVNCVSAGIPSHSEPLHLCLWWRALLERNNITLTDSISRFSQPVGFTVHRLYLKYFSLYNDLGKKKKKNQHGSGMS